MYQFNPSLFNPQQLQAVLHGEGPMLVLAGAGSGKTRIIAHRVAYLVEKLSIPPETVVAVSFTNKAARELRQRIAELIGPKKASRCHLSTFHALGADILRSHITLMGWKMPYAILDTEDQIGIIKDVLKDMHLQGSTYDPQSLLNFISRVKTAHKAPMDMPGMRWNPQGRTLAKVFEHYQAVRKSLNGIDFDDMIALPVEIFETYPEVLNQYIDAYQYLLVDEYQDTNELQFRLLKLLCRDRANLMVVGDDDQSIYAFRGAESKHILEFPKSFDNVRIVSLEQNYRSTQIILDAANAVIAQNKMRHAKNLWSEAKSGDKIQAVECANPEEEASFVIEQIQQQRAARNLHFRDFAILYRTNPQSRAIEDVLIKNALPYHVVGGSRFYEHTEIRDLIFYLRTAFSFHDELALRRIINVPRRGIAASALSRIDERSKSQGVSFFDSVRLEVDAGQLQASAKIKLTEFISTLDVYHKRFHSKSEPLSKVMSDLIESIHYIEYIQSSSSSDVQAQSRKDNVDEFIAAIDTYERHEGRDLFGFLQRLAIEPPQKNEDIIPDEITLMTIHSSKGLEFSSVYIVGCEENLLPHANSIQEPALSEERRLFYVGITRAKKYLTLTYSKYRKKMYETIEIHPSRFLKDIPQDTIQFANASSSDAVKALQDENKAKMQDRIERMRALFKK